MSYESIYSVVGKFLNKGTYFHHFERPYYLVDSLNSCYYVPLLLYLASLIASKMTSAEEMNEEVNYDIAFSMNDLRITSCKSVSIQSNSMPSRDRRCATKKLAK